MRFSLFLHEILLETFDDSLLCHKGGDFVPEITFSGIDQGVHSLNTSLNNPETTI